MKSYQKILAVIVLSSLCLATAAASEGEVSAKKSKKHQKAEVAAPCEACEAIKRLEEKVAAQQAEIDMLKGMKPEAPGTTDAAAQAAAAAAQQQAAAAAAAAADAAAKAAAAQADVNALKPEVNSNTAGVQEAQKKIGVLEEPAYIHYKGVKLTPGGYAQLATIYRAHDANSDTADTYGSYAYANSPTYYQSEFRESGRASRVSLKATGEASGMKFLQYTEIDFLGNAAGNETQTNSFSPRLRLAFANVDFKGGWSIAGGQNWSLLQTTRKGINPLSEWLPAVIDNAYTPGFTYAREGSLRVVNQITPKIALGFAVENPDTVVAGGSTVSGFTSAIQGTANSSATISPNSGYLNATGSNGNTTGNPSINVAPDLVAKIAFDPGWGHFDVKYVTRFFRDRVYPDFNGAATAPYTTGANTAGGTNRTNIGGAIGLGMILPVVKNIVDIDFQGLAGAGIGRYTTTAGPDVTYRPDGSLEPVKGISAVIGIETHPTPKLDIDLYAGEDYYRRLTYNSAIGSSFFGGAPTTAVQETGYGYQANNDAGCSVEGTLTSAGATTGAGGQPCSGLTKDVWSIQPQIWYRLYKGKAGTVQFGASYAYVWREGWAAKGPVVDDVPVSGIPPCSGLVSPKTINQIAMAAFRYYLP